MGVMRLATTLTMLVYMTQLPGIHKPLSVPSHRPSLRANNAAAIHHPTLAITTVPRTFDLCGHSLWCIAIPIAIATACIVLSFSGRHRSLAKMFDLRQYMALYIIRLVFSYSIPFRTHQIGSPRQFVQLQRRQQFSNSTLSKPEINV